VLVSPDTSRRNLLVQPLKIGDAERVKRNSRRVSEKDKSWEVTGVVIRFTSGRLAPCMLLVT
jgi:hypothetical protein